MTGLKTWTMILVTEDHIDKDDIKGLLGEFSDELSDIEDLTISNFRFDMKSSKNKYQDIDRDDDENFHINIDKWMNKSQKVIEKLIKKK